MLISAIRPIPDAAFSFVQAHEGCRLTAYLDSAGVPTVGYGHAGVAVHLGQTITQDQADDYLRQDLATAAQRLESAVGEACVTELTANQYAALLSFVFNVGIDPKWRICQLLKAQKFDQIPAELMRFVNAGGKKLQGLVNRRADEVKLWSTDEPGSVPVDPSSAYSRTVDTPPTASAAASNPLLKTWHYVLGLGSMGASVAAENAPKVKGVIDRTSDAIAPYAGHSAVVQGISDHLALVAACMAALTVGAMVISHQKAKTS